MCLEATRATPIPSHALQKKECTQPGGRNISTSLPMCAKYFYLQVEISVLTKVKYNKMAVPATYNITAYKNDTLQLVFTFTDSSGAPIDLSTATMLMQVRKKAGDTVALALTEGNGLTVSGAGNNIVTISKVISIAADIYQYDMQATFASGVIRTFIKGKFTVPADITN